MRLIGWISRRMLTPTSMRLPGSSGNGDCGASADPVRWAKTHDIFHAALALPLDQRAEFLASACGADEALQTEVSSLIASDMQAGDFIEQPAAALLATADAIVFTPRLTTGATLGRYEVLEFLGAGGISEVYRARDTRLGRTVALKLVTDPRDPEAGSRLLLEAQHASILNHPNICGVHEAEDGERLPFIVLELVEGPTLHDVLKERRPSIAEIVQWGREIASALDHAHRRGVIHRDLKSANVALSPDGAVKVLDFGLSRRTVAGDGVAQSPESILTDASVAGTLTHIAPEVLRREPLDARVDLWALGVMLYEMASGVLPFKRSTAFETAEAILHAVPDPLPSHVPTHLQRLILRCLAKDPDSRVATAAELRTELTALQVDVRDRPRVARLWAIVTGVLGVIVGTGTLYNSRPLLRPAMTTPTLAVLPLVNPAGGADQGFFADGFTETLIAGLGRVDGIRVIAATTSMRYRDGDAPSEQIARAAGASHVLEGAVARIGDEVHLSVRLTEALTNRVIWTDEYRRAARDVHALQADVSAALARAVRVELAADDAKHFAGVRAIDPDVYEAYLKGRYHWNQRTADSLRTAIGYYETALKLDPTYAPAYAALADCYNQLGTVLVNGGSPRVWRPKAAEATIKALQIDQDLAEAHATLGYVRHYDWQWDEAERSFRRAIALNASNPLARIWYSNFLCSRLRFDEAIREALIARDLDPLSLIVSTNVGWVYYMARRNDEAIAEFERGLKLDPTYLQAHMRLAGSFGYAGRHDKAIAESETVVRLSPGNLANIVALEQVKMLAARANEFDRRIAELIAGLPKSYAPPSAIANALLSAGRIDEAFKWLQAAYNERTNNMVYLGVDPVYDRVRDDPRFHVLTRAVGLP
jgi:eukaryotic-like serine/threonine-protein kinase